METVLAEETVALVAKIGGFVYFFKRIENEMISKAKNHFTLIMWMLRAFKWCQMKTSQIRGMTQDLKNLTKVFYFKKCAMHKEIENYRNQVKIKIALVRRTKNLAQDMGKFVKKSTKEAAFRNLGAAPQKLKGIDGRAAYELKCISLSLAETWWTLLEKSMQLTEARILLIKKSLKMIEKKERWENLLGKLFLQAAMAAQLGTLVQRRRIELKGMELQKMAKIYGSQHKETLYCNALDECEVLESLAKEVGQISETILSEFFSQEKVEN